ncbi:MAG: LysE family translocator [Alphaproteobacteria bacterium]
MPFDSILALFGILLAATWTPGPNNLMLASSGATFGFRRTIPHIAGVAIGFGFMLFTVALGLGEVFERIPVLQIILRWAGAALLLWIAWRIANTKAPGEAGARTKPFSFLQASAFQWVNPKAWAMCIGVVGQFMHGDNPVLVAAIMAFVSIAAGSTSATSWTSFGAYLQKWLKSPTRLKMFNYTMAGIIVAGVIAVLWTGL